MGTIIRNNIFETNSSSSHSLVISDDPEIINDGTIIPDEEGVVYLNGGQFGWGYEKYADALTKANYCAVDAMYYESESRIDNIKEAICNIVKCSNVQFNFSFDYDDSNWSYIDHQSLGTSTDELYSVADYKNFIFNPNCKLILDNDN